MSKAKNKAIREFMTSSEFTELLDKNYTASFEDFCLDSTKAFPGLHFNAIKLPIVAESPLVYKYILVHGWALVFIPFATFFEL